MARSAMSWLVAVRLAVLSLSLFSLVQAVPVQTSDLVSRSSSSSYWLANIKRQGVIPFGGDSSYQVFRNVMDFGAKGDGSTDDTAAINQAISSGNRCGQGCDSSTTTPALVYFPPGTYVVSSPIIQYYYTQLVGDAVNPPTIKPTSSFTGIAVIDSDPYDSSGANWYTNQNNFFRQVRNFVIDLTGMPSTTGAGIHWQVAQATSLQNIVFNMVQGGGESNKQQGIFMDNGSGGFFSDLVFNGGNYGAFLGNQQFTTRNLTFNNCQTGVYMNWNWLWALKSVTFNGCGIGIDMSNSPTNQTVGSVILQDSTFKSTPIGVSTAFSSNSIPISAGSLIIDNVDFTGCSTAAIQSANSTVLAGGSKVSSWIQGAQYTGSQGDRGSGVVTGPSKPSVLLDSSGDVFERSRPQYETVPVGNFVSVMDKGAKGDGVTDDTQAIQNAANSLSSGDILYFDHGAYVISSTVKIPSNILITGEIWPMIMAKGSAFSNADNPTPVFQVGQPGDTGNVEISELIFETIGPQPGAIMVEWNVAGSSAGSVGMWDSHGRIGGTSGTQLQSNTCANNTQQTTPNLNCEGAFLLLHVTPQAEIYLENSWWWVADHELDLPDHNQVTIYNGRGVLIETTKAAWLYGTASEHSVLYNYNIANAQNVYMSIIQTETAYFQANPGAPAPFTPNAQYNDPTFAGCTGNQCKTWGLISQGSSNVMVYGAGIYSFFDNYAQSCIADRTCQADIISITNATDNYLFALTTIGTTNMVMNNNAAQVPAASNGATFGSTIARWVAS